MAMRRISLLAVLSASLLWPSVGITTKVTGVLDSETPQPILVLRLAHTGSSWLTAMISSMDDTYITREGVVMFESSVKWPSWNNLTSHDISSYIKTALRKPHGNILGTKIQMYPYENEKVKDCLAKFGDKCPVKFVGLTMDPVGIKPPYRDDVYSNVNKAYPDLPVLVYRRTNIVKRALASAGNDPTEDNAKTNVYLDPELFMQLVKDAVNNDNALLQAQTHFPNTMMLTYEKLQMDPVGPMNDAFGFFGMPKAMTAEIAGVSEKKSSEDLRDALSNFDELEALLQSKSPCLADQFRSNKVEIFTPCPPMSE